MAIVQTKIKRFRNGELIRGTVARDTSVYPNADATFLSDVRAAKFAVTLSTGEVIPASSLPSSLPPVQNKVIEISGPYNPGVWKIELDHYDAQSDLVYWKDTSPFDDGRTKHILMPGHGWVAKNDLPTKPTRRYDVIDFEVSIHPANLPMHMWRDQDTCISDQQLKRYV